MEIVGITLISVGLMISFVYGIILLVKAFQTSIWWGLGYLLVPLVALVFIVVHWEVAKQPFLTSLTAIPFIAVGLFLFPGIVNQLM